MKVSPLHDRIIVRRVEDIDEKCNAGQRVALMGTVVKTKLYWPHEPSRTGWEGCFLYIYSQQHKSFVWRIFTDDLNGPTLENYSEQYVPICPIDPSD